MHTPIRTLISIAVAGVLANQVAHAGAFSLYTESSAAKIGNFAAGAAADGSDASIGWYNPAGLVLIEQQELVLSGVGIFPSSKLTGMSTFNTNTEIPGIGVVTYQQRFSGIQGAENAFVPAIHYAKPLGPRATAGLSIVAPFGLSTNWGEKSPVRYQATLTDLKTINVSPELGGKLTDNLSIGGGIDFQWAQVKFNQMLGSPAVLQNVNHSPPMYLDSLSYNKGHSFNMGFHAGLLGLFNDNHTRIGINYQSQVKHQFHGYSVLTGRLADTELMNPDAQFRSNHLFSNTVALPDMTTLSVYQDVNERLALLASAIYAGWHPFKVIQLNDIAGFDDDLNHPDFGPHLLNNTAINDYDSAWRFALGANINVNESFMLRVGGGYDITPTTNRNRDVRLPDANRWAASIGGHYQAIPALGFDLGYTYLWGDGQSKINKTNPLGMFSNYNVTARGNNHVHLVGLQAVWMIDYHEMNTK